MPKEYNIVGRPTHKGKGCSGKVADGLLRSSQEGRKAPHSMLMNGESFGKNYRGIG